MSHWMSQSQGLSLRVCSMMIRGAQNDKDFAGLGNQTHPAKSVSAAPSGLREPSLQISSDLARFNLSHCQHCHATFASIVDHLQQCPCISPTTIEYKPVGHAQHLTAIFTFVNALPTSLDLHLGSVSRHVLLNALKEHQDTQSHHQVHQFSLRNLQQDLNAPRRLNPSVQWLNEDINFVSSHCQTSSSPLPPSEPVSVRRVLSLPVATRGTRSLDTATAVGIRASEMNCFSSQLGISKGSTH
jgi:hypothetical protein